MADDAKPVEDGKANVIMGAGTASAGGLKPGEIQDAMTQAIHTIAKETEAIAHHPTMSPAEKGEAIAKLNHPDEAKRRMMQARAEVKAAAAEREQVARRGMKAT